MLFAAGLFGYIYLRLTPPPAIDASGNPIPATSLPAFAIPAALYISTALILLVAVAAESTRRSANANNAPRAARSAAALLTLGLAFVFIQTPALIGLLNQHHAAAQDTPGFYDDVPEPSAEETKQWDTLGFSDAEWAGSIGMNAVHGEAGYTTLQRRWVRPSCDVNGIYGGYMGEGAKTVIATHAGAKVSFRLAPNQDATKIEAAFRKWIESQTPPGCRWEILSHGGANPVMIPTDSPWLTGAQRAIRQGCGIDAVMVRDGASIPVVATFKQALGLDTMLIGFGLHDDNLHSPNEKFELANFKMGRRTHAALLYELSKR